MREKFVKCKWGELVCTILRLDVLGHFGVRECIPIWYIC